tara:strand:+ start:4138 stop:5034 length:897 start_codon:yes stop_codon:yes gene_type:complete
MNKLKVLDLFSGIGGFSLGLEWTGGFETVAFCEIEKFPQQVLKKHWSHVPIYSDVKELTYEKLKADGIVRPDIIAGGFPCQPFSVAGKQAGERDERHLWGEMFRLVKECRPSWVIGENVSGHIKLGLDTVLDNLESEGYSARTFSISASSIGAKHKRERVWIIANSECNGQFTSKESRGIGETISKESEGSNDSFNVEGASGLSTSEQDVSNSNSERGCSGNASGENATNARELQGGERRNTRTMEVWDVEPELGRVAHGIPNRSHRIKALGNSVVPQIPMLIGEAILKTIKEESCTH